MNSKVKHILEEIEESNPDALKADGFDDCIIGICRTFHGCVLLYDEDKVIKKLMKDNMTWEEAWEFYEFNIIGSYMGDYTPIFRVEI